MFRLKSLGALALEGPDGPLGGSASQRRTLALLALLAAAGDKGVSRERLTALLWPDSDEDRARHVLAQMVYRVRQQLGDSSIEGSTTLRLNAEALGSDVRDFERALARAEWESAVRAYGGPFLEGFYLPEASEFERWAESERGRLTQRYAGALDRLASAARARGDPGTAAEWSRGRAAIDPLDSRAATQLLESLAAAGDIPGALQYARVYESLLHEQLDTTPPTEFVELVTKLRATPTGTTASAGRQAPESATSPQTMTPAIVSPATPSAHPTKPVAAPDNEQVVAASAAIRLPDSAKRHFIPVALVAMLAVAGVGFALLRNAQSPPAARHTIAVGYIADYTDDTLGAGRVVPELLATSLSRLERVDVIGRSRLYDLIARLSGEKADARGFARAAEHAGAAELVDGALYRKADGSLRLDVRVLDLRSGVVRAVHQISARDAFALTDTATIRLAGTFGLPAPEGLRVADVTTSSPVAYRFYEEGLRAVQQRDLEAARRLFTTALSIDSSFAMAAYWTSLVYGDLHNWPMATASLERALRLREHATERERLLIEARWAHFRDDPARVTLARRVTAQYPSDPEAHLMLGQAMHWQGDFAGAIVAFRQALALDSSSLRSDTPRCIACEAVSEIARAFEFMDSLPRAEQYARFFVESRPNSPYAWNSLRDALFGRDDFEGALAADRRRQALLAHDDAPLFAPRVAMKKGDFERADAVLTSFAVSGTPAIRGDAMWWLTISQRYQGRLNDALRSVRQIRHTLHEIQVLVERGQLKDAARLSAFPDSSWRRWRTSPSPGFARAITWALLHHAAALAAAGDTARLESIADSMESVGRRSGYGRDHLLHHHVRALILKSRGQKQAAVQEFRRAIWSTTAGYTRTNFELGRLLIELGRADDAIPLLQAALRNDGQASALYVTFTELHALLARAFAETGPADSARVHRQWAERAWRNADPAVKDRIPALLNIPVAGRPPER